MKDVLALFGFCVIALAIAGHFDIGHFRLYYGADPRGCTQMEAKWAAEK